MEERDLDEGRILILPFVGGLLSGWGVGMYDFDNDGHKDLFTANSHVSENAGALDPRNPYHQHNALFHNESKGRFRDVSAATGLHALPPAAHRGAAFGDLNNDGTNRCGGLRHRPERRDPDDRLANRGRPLAHH